MADDKIVYSVEANTKSIEKSLENIDTKAKEIGSTSFESLGASISKIGPMALAAATALGTYLVGKGIKDGIQAAVEQENALNKMNNALSRAGRLTQDASNDFINYASELQKTRNVADDVAMGYLGLATNFTKSNAEAKKLVSSAIDMSAALGISAESAIRTLGGSLSGVSGQLAKVIPQTRGLTEEQLKQGAAIDLVSEKFRGAGAAAATTYSGALMGIKLAFGDFLEEIGMFFVKSESLRKAFVYIRDAVVSLTQKFAGFREDSGDIFAPILKGISYVAQAVVLILGPTIEIVINIFQKAGRIIGSFGAAITELFTGNFRSAAEIGKSAFLEVFDPRTYASVLDFSGSAKAWNFFGEEFRESISAQKEPIAEQISTTIGAAIEQVAMDIPEITPTVSYKSLSDASKNIIDIGQMIASSLTSSFQKIGTVLAKGGMSFGTFAEIALEFIGDFAIQLGTFIITASLAIMALKYEILTFGTGWAIAAGAALVIFGAALKAFAGGPAAKSDGAASAAQAVTPIQQTVGDETTALNQNERQRQTNIEVNIAGNVLGDKRTLGLEIADALNEAFGNDGIIIARGAIS